MIKFIIGSFAILAWAFYVLSGGSDFVPDDRLVATEPAPAQPAPAALGPAGTDGIDIVTIQADPVEAEPTRSETVMPATPVAEPIVTALPDPGMTVTEEPAAVDPEVTAPTRPTQAPAITAPRTAGSSTDIVTTDDPFIASLSGTGNAGSGGTQIREVSARAVNMRDGPGTEFTVIDTLPQGTRADIVASDGTGWVQVIVPGTGMTGWMAERLLTGG